MKDYRTVSQASLRVFLCCVGTLVAGCSPVGRYINVLRSGDEEQKRQAVCDIQLLGPRGAKAIPELRAAARSADPELRRMAVEAIGGMGRKAWDGHQVIIGGLKDPDKNVRRASAIAISRLDKFPTPAFPSLIACLGDSDSLVREFSICAFIDIGRSGIGSLVRALKDPDPAVRLNAIRAIDRMDGEGVIAMGALKKTASEDPEPAVRDLAGAAAKRLSMCQRGREGRR